MGRAGAFLSIVALLLAACSPAPRSNDLPDNNIYGANPELPAPNAGLAPVVNPAKAIGWPLGGAPTAPEGFTVTRYFDDLDHPRWLYMLPNGDVLVAQSSTEAAEGEGLMGWIRNLVQDRAGALGESAGVITLLRDADGDGDVDSHSIFAQSLNQPFGMALVGDYVYVANTDAVVRFPYSPNAVRLASQPETVLDLPFREGDNGHWTRSLVANADGTKLYVAVGSASNIGDHGMEAEDGRAAIWEFNPDGSDARVFASGLRNPVGTAFEPNTQALWVVVNERDMLGENLVPDYLASVRDGGFYGWPYSYFGQHVDDRVEPQNPDLVAAALAPDYALGAHTASLGLHFYTAAALPEHYRGGAFIGQHGSWNRSELAGYRVVFVPFAEGRPSGDIEPFLTGFLSDRDEAYGRPVGIIADRTGALLVADDVGDVIWRVAPAN